MKTAFLLGLTVSLVHAQTILQEFQRQDDASVDDAIVDSSAAISTQPYEPMSLKQRFQWAARSSVSPRRMAGYVFTSAIGTAENSSPREYGPHWDGFAKRFGLRMSTGATSLLVETSIGSLWSEDPRYVRATGQPLKARLFNIVKMTVLARDREGKLVPAYARYMAVPASNFITNAWRPDSQASPQRAVARIPLSFGDRAIANAFTEFWPEIKKLLHRH